MNKLVLGSCLAIFLSGCATISIQENIPVTFTFLDGSEGSCDLKNKRGAWKVEVPGQQMIRRSDDDLVYACQTTDGRRSEGKVISDIEAVKFGASALLLDLGITDEITDKHRTYQSHVVIPVRKKK